MKKDIINYEVFLQEYIYKKFGPFDRSALKEDLGIDDGTYCLAIENKKKLSKKTYMEVERFISTIKKMIKNEVVLRQLIGRISFICSYGNVVIDGNHLTGEFVSGGNCYYSELCVSNNKVSSYVTNNSDFFNILYCLDINEDSVTYNKRNETVFESDDKMKTCYDVFHTTITKNYNKNGKEFFRFKEETNNNFIKNNENGDIKLIEPSYPDNYELRDCWWRVDGFILSTYYSKHANENNADFKYLIGIDDNPDNNELIYPDKRFCVNKENIELYTTGQISTRELWEETKRNYVRIISYWP